MYIRIGFQTLWPPCTMTIVYIIISPHWTSSEMGADGFGLNFCVRACVRIHFSDIHLPILFKLSTQMMNDDLHKHVIFFSRSDPRWLTGGHFLDWMCPQQFLRHAWSNFVQTWHKDNTWWYTNSIWPTGGHFSYKKNTWCWTWPQPFLVHAFTDVV